MREEGGDVVVAGLLLHRLEFMLDTLHLSGVAVKQSRPGTLHTLPSQLFPYLQRS